MQGRGKDLRIGDPERERAITLLGEHLTAGRLDINEYDQRCTQVTAARFTSELHRVFDDLPGPLPASQQKPAPASNDRSSGVALPLAFGVGLFLLAIVARQVWLLPVAAILVAIWFGRRRQ